MLKLSILVGLLLPVAETVLNSTYSSISSIPKDKTVNIQKYLSLIQEIQQQNQNGLLNNRTTPFQSKTPTITIPIPIPIQT